MKPKTIIILSVLLLISLALGTYIFCREDPVVFPEPEPVPENVNKILYTKPSDINKLIPGIDNELYGPEVTNYINSNFTLNIVIVPNNKYATIANSFSRFPMIQVTNDNHLRIIADWSIRYQKPVSPGIPVKIKIQKNICDFDAFIDDIHVYNGAIIENPQFGSCDENGVLHSETNTLLIRGYNEIIKDIQLR